MKQRLIIASMICLSFLLPSCQHSDNKVSDAVPDEIASTSPFLAPSLTATELPTVTATPTSLPTFIPTVTPTITPTPIPMPRLRVVFSNSEGLWAVNPPASPVRISQGNKLPELDIYLSLSDDGKEFVYLTGYDLFLGPLGIHAMNFNGSGDRELLSESQANVLEKKIGEQTIKVDPTTIKWIPGTHRMLFSTMAVSVKTDENALLNDLFVINVDTGAVSRLFARNVGGMAYPSPDGKKMVIENYEAVFLASTRGTILYKEIIPFYYDVFLLEPFYRNGTTVWAGDSSRFGIIVPSGLLDKDAGGEPGPNASILSIDASNGVTTIVGTITKYGRGVLSPTLEYVGYSRFGKNYRLSYDATITRVDGSSPILLASGISRFDSFSPDGRYFSYSSGCAKGVLSDCPSDAPDLKIFIASLDGELFQVPGVIQWINNSQFVFVDGTSLRLGDIGGNSIEIANAKDFYYFDAKDLDFNAGEK